MSDVTPTSAETPNPVIDIRGLVNRFGDNVVHQNLDLRVEPGEILGVVGGSGTGKSVLLRTIIGLNKPNAGTIRLFGETLDHQSWHRLSQALWRAFSEWRPVLLPHRAGKRRPATD
jgi:ABC-type transport system involved in resistance to organic solvents, ATPase component